MVVASIALVVALTLVIAATLTARHYAADRLDRSARQRVDQAASLSAVAVSENVDRLTNSALALADSPELRASITANDGARSQALVEQLQRSTQGALLAFLATPDGTLTHMYPVDRKVIGVRFAQRDWYHGVQRVSPYLSKAYQTAAFDKPQAVSIAARVDDHGRRMGILVVVVESSQFGQALLRAARAEGAPELVIRDQSGGIVAGTIRTNRSDAVVATRDIRGTDWQLVASVPASAAFADLRNFRRAATTFAILLCGLLGILGLLLYASNHLLARAQRAAERREQAFELNDTIIQRLAIAHLALSVGRTEDALAALDAAISDGRRIIGTLAEGRPSYVRSAAAHARVPEDGKVSR